MCKLPFLGYMKRSCVGGGAVYLSTNLSIPKNWPFSLKKVSFACDVEKAFNIKSFGFMRQKCCLDVVFFSARKKIICNNKEFWIDILDDTII